MRRFLFALIMFGLVVGGMAEAQGRVRAVITGEVANIRIIPNFGGEPLGQVPGGYLIDPVTARDGSNDWLRFNFNGTEAWVHISTLSIIEGNLDALPIADPRTIPYGGFDRPRAGLTSNTGGQTVTVRDWLRVRSGPSTGYVVLDNIPINEPVIVLGRTIANNWIQVNYNGTLGWVSAEWLNFPPEVTIPGLPVDGIVAERPPGDNSPEEFLGTLQFMLDRLRLAEPSLVAIRTAWADAALTGRASCQPYPAQPSNINIPNPVLSAYFNTLDPLREQFNDAMFNVRLAIQLFIDACNQPGTVNPVGQATAQGALETISLAERQFADLRAQLNVLLPEGPGFGIGECPFEFGGAVEILPVIQLTTIYRVFFDREDYAAGYCFDAIRDQTLRFAVAQEPGGNADLLITVSPLDDPTDFLATGRSTSAESILTLGPLTIPETGRYLLVVSNVVFPEDAALESEVVVYIYPSTSAGLARDPVTGQIIEPIIIPPLQGIPPVQPLPGATPIPGAPPGGTPIPPLNG